MTVDLFDYGKEDFIPEIEEWVGGGQLSPPTTSKPTSICSSEPRRGRKPPLSPDYASCGIAA
ncbi:MAG: DsrE/DsrF/DrsH-like family protein [Gammaproteobacteria bacterium]|nr:DsrE/DsrF/DrsH-like family protein [Gammaproteobacteria bacterium]